MLSRDKSLFPKKTDGHHTTLLQKHLALANPKYCLHSKFYLILLFSTQPRPKGGLCMLKSLVFLLIAFILVCAAWRLSSQRYHIPCPSWLGWMVEMDNPFTHINRAATIIEHLAIKPGSTIIDFGCGPGRITLPAAQAVGTKGSIIAVDTQSSMLKRTQKKAQERGLKNITYTQATLGTGTLPLPHNHADYALLVTVLGEIPNQQAALKEIYSTLKQGGTLSITELIFDPHFQRKTTVRSLAQDAGFKETNVFGGWHAYTMHFIKESTSI